MPDHLHLIAQPGSNAITLGSWVKALKAYLRRRTNQKEVWSWQAGYHDHKFRSAAEKARKWEYICLNPVRAGLVASPEVWPYAGEVTYQSGAPTTTPSTPALLRTYKLVVEDARSGTGPTIQPKA